MLPYLHLWHLQVPTFGLMLWLAAVAPPSSWTRLQARRHRRRRCGDGRRRCLLGIVGAKLWHVIDTPIEFREYGWHVLWIRPASPGTAACFSASPPSCFRAGGPHRRPAHSRSGRTCRRHRLWHRTNRLFSLRDGCYGIPTTLPWAMSFPTELSPLSRVSTPRRSMNFSLPYHRLLSLASRAKPHGTGAIVGQYLILTGVARFLVEFVRRNPKSSGIVECATCQRRLRLAGILLVWWAATRRVTDPGTAPIPVEKVA